MIIIWYKDNLPLNFGLDPLGHKRNVIDYQTDKISDTKNNNNQILITSILYKNHSFYPLKNLKSTKYALLAKIPQLSLPYSRGQIR
mgnify:CR=1 FL=1